jgi:hypothetical protein
MPPKSIIPASNEGRPETDYEYGQRMVENMDRSMWQGEHPMKIGPHGIVHKLEVSEHVPHIYKAK